LETKVRAMLKVMVHSHVVSCLFSSKSNQARNCGKATRTGYLKTTQADTSTNTSTKKTSTKIKLTR